MIEYSCLAGHILEGNDKATCTPSGLWSSRPPSCRYVECPRLSKIKSGTAFLVNGTSHIGSLVRYTCDRSHTLVGLEERACLPNGRWSGSPPDCSEIRCKLPERPNNTVISVSSTERLHGTSVSAVQAEHEDQLSRRQHPQVPLRTRIHPPDRRGTRGTPCGHATVHHDRRLDRISTQMQIR